MFVNIKGVSPYVCRGYWAGGCESISTDLFTITPTARLNWSSDITILKRFNDPLDRNWGNFSGIHRRSWSILVFNFYCLIFELKVGFTYYKTYNYLIPQQIWVIMYIWKSDFCHTQNNNKKMNKNNAPSIVSIHNTV